jgi:hypothetical protein
MTKKTLGVRLALSERNNLVIDFPENGEDRVEVKVSGELQGRLSVGLSGNLLFTTKDGYTFSLVEHGDDTGLPAGLRAALEKFLANSEYPHGAAVEFYPVVEKLLRQKPKPKPAEELLQNLKADLIDATEGRSATREQSRESALRILDELIRRGNAKGTPEGDWEGK